MPLRETLEQKRSGPPPTGEKATKSYLIEPILRDLGWDTGNPEQVLYEYAVGGGYVDIALKGPQGIVALVEAKAPGQNLSNHVNQVLRYDAFDKGADICVLRTGLEWWLYLPREVGTPEERRFTSLRIERDPVEQLADDLETFLGKENLVTGQAQKRAKQVLKARHQAAKVEAELPEVWQSMLTEPNNELVDLVRQRAYEEIGLRPDFKQVAAVLSGSPVPTIVSLNPDTTQPAPIPPKLPGKRAKSKKPSGFRIWDEHYSFKTWKHMLISVGEALYRRHTSEFDRVLTLQGRKRPHASRNPDDLRAAHQVGSSGIYFEKNLNAKGIEKRSYEFLALFGYPPSDLDIQYE